MNEDIIAKLHTALYHISPLASERERIIVKLGEVIWLETLEEVLLALPESKREVVIQAINNNDMATAVSVCEDEQIPIESILEKVADRVFREEIE
jgi:hypothetical protein